MKATEHISKVESPYPIFSEVFKYPGKAFVLQSQNCYDYLKSTNSEAAKHYLKFHNWVLKTPLDEMEERYTKTFHIQAICYLDLGYVIFGEDYKRGEFLVNMKREQKEANNPCGTELPDNLVNVLTLFPKINNEEFRKELGVMILIPALKKMLAEFDSSRMEMRERILRKKHKALLLENKKHGNIFQYVIKALLDVVEKDFEGIKFEEPEKQVPPQYSAAGCGCSFVTNKTTKTLKS